MSGAKRSAGADVHWNRAWAAFVFGAIGVIALALIAFVLTTQRPSTPSAGPMVLTQIPAPNAASPSRPSSSSSRPSAKRSTPKPPATRSVSTPVRRAAVPASTSASVVSQPTRTVHPNPAGPCRSAAPCVVGGSGNVATALAAYRRAHGSAPVPAVVTAAAQQCALTGGDGSCANPFAVAREVQLNGDAAIRDIGAGTGNFLLDPSLRAVEVGWAYDPPTRQYVCVLIERT